MIHISLAAARVNAGLTQADVAKHLRVSNKTVVNWENGHAVPSLATVHVLSEMYNIPIDALILPDSITKSDAEEVIV